MKKTVLFVPGFRENTDSRNYKSTIKAIEKSGYDVVFVPIKWERTTMVEWVKQFEVTYSKYTAANTILAGFSFGAMTALSAAAARNPSELWLFSLSPYYSDDIDFLKKSRKKYIGKNRAAAFSRLNFSKIAGKINCKTLLFAGEFECQKIPELGRRTEKASLLISTSSTIYIPNTDHDATDPKYISAIIDNI